MLIKVYKTWRGRNVDPTARALHFLPEFALYVSDDNYLEDTYGEEIKYKHCIDISWLIFTLSFYF